MSGNIFPANREWSLRFKDMGEMANLVGQKMASYPNFTTERNGPHVKATAKWEGWTISVTSSSEARALYAVRELLAYKLLETELCYIYWHNAEERYFGTFRPFALYENMKTPMTQHYNSSYSVAPLRCPEEDQTDDSTSRPTHAIGTETGAGTIRLKYV